MPTSYGQRSIDPSCLRPTPRPATAPSVFSWGQNGTNCLKSRRSHITKNPTELWHNTWRSTQVIYGERFKDIKGQMQNIKISKVERQQPLFSKTSYSYFSASDWDCQPRKVIKKRSEASRRPPVVPVTQISSPFTLTWAQRSNPYPESLTSVGNITGQSSLNSPGFATYLYTLCLEYSRFITN